MKTILVALDHGLAHAYFLETELPRLLVEKGARIVCLVPRAFLPSLMKNYAQENVIFDSLRDDLLNHYRNHYYPRLQEYFEHIRRACASTRIPLTWIDTHRQRNEYEAKGLRKIAFISLRPLISIIRHSRWARWFFRYLQERFFTPRIYDDLFDKYHPDLLVCNSAGWRLDQYLLREARRRKIKTVTTVIGWDNPSNHGLPGAFVDHTIVWSEEHKREMVEGVDWPAERVHIGGMPLYDGYINRKWLMPREEYFSLHHLDPNKKVIAFAASALSVTPNFHLIKTLVELLDSGGLVEPAQLLIRLHPNHFNDKYAHYQLEAQAIRDLVKPYPDVHLVEPTQVPDGRERYSIEDYPEKSSMLAHSDVLVTIYSTMLVEALLHGKPTISVLIESNEGWPGYYWVPMKRMSTWPNTSRTAAAKASRIVFSIEELQRALNDYLANPSLDADHRQRFIEQELTFLAGEATQRTADIIWDLANETDSGKDR